MRLRSGFVAVLLSASWIAVTAAPSGAVRPRVDVAARPAAASPAARTAAEFQRAHPGLRALGTVASVDERFGRPSFVWAVRTGRPAGTPRATAGGSRLAAAEAARAHLERFAPFYDLTAADVRQATLRNVHDTGRGGVIASFRQTVNGIEVFRDEVRVLMDRDHELVAIAGAIPGRAAAGKGAPGAFRLGAPAAIARALGDFTGTAVEAGAVRPAGTRAGGFEAFDVRGARGAAADLAVDPAMRAKRVWFHVVDGLVPAWYTEVIGEDEAFSYVVSAVDGAILFRNDLMAADAYSYRVWADAAGLQAPFDGPQGNVGTPHPTGLPDFYSQAFVAPSLVSLEHGPISTNDPWLPPAATQTAGNNVDAYADLVAPDGFSAGDLRATTTGPNAFDRVYDTSLAPGASSAQRMAAVTQLFYDNNFLHDWFYDSGFDEASGNAQASNFGRGGIEGDAIRAEAQDYSGTNNANMNTPSDGAPPRMQMYVFQTSAQAGVRVVSPSPAAYASGLATGFGPQTFSVTANLVLGVDAVAPVNDGCSAITNPVAGKIVLLDRGTCAYAVKVAAAQAAGAVGVIVADNVSGSTPPAMGGADGSITIPALSVTLASGNALKAALGGGTVTVTMAREPARDGTIDNLIVAHEWGHYISNRLIGDANGLSTQQSGGMGEGWGDFTAMMLLVKPGDDLIPANTNFAGVYSTSPYAAGGTASPSNTYYFGLRRYPYSTDIANRNPLTFRHIEAGVALPVGPPVAFGANGANNAEVHATGEVWCTMLWECYAALLRDTGRLTFDQARDRMRDYLVAGYKMTPDAPTFVEARDAILAAAFANDPNDYELFWQAFAKRGIGVGAIAPDRFSEDNAGVVESYLVGGALDFVSATLEDDVISCDNDGYLDNGEVGHLTVTLRNSGSVGLGATTATVTSTNPAVSFPGTNQIAFPASTMGQAIAGTVDVRLLGAVGITSEDFRIDYDDPGLVVGGPITASLETAGNIDEIPSTTETVEARVPAWGMTDDPLLGGEPWARAQATATSHYFHVVDAGALGDHALVSPPLDVAGAGNFTFSFEHRYSFESSAGVDYDAGVIELSTNGGTTWTDIGASASPGYDGTVFVGADNPLSGRPAFCNTSPSWPASNVVNVNLGTAYAGQTVRVRFRLGTDQAAADYGWDIDNLVFHNLTNQPFVDVVADPDVCDQVAVEPALPTAWSLSLASANPGSGPASLRFALPQAGHVTLSIFDVRGRRMATLVDGDYGAGVHTATWSPTAARPAGVYFAHLDADGRRFTRRLVVLP